LFIFYCPDTRIYSQMNLIILLVLKDPPFDSVFDYLFVHVGISFHKVSYFGIERVFSVGIGHDEDEPTDDHGQGNSWSVVLSYERQTDCSFVADVGVVYSMQTLDFRSIDRVHIWKGQLEDNLALSIERL
jgi:hypothetical protein